MNRHLNSVQLILNFVLISGIFGTEIGVPVLLWQQKTGLPEIDSQFDSKSTVYQIDGKVLADDYLADEETIVAFVQNRLSLEQLTAEDEQRLTAIKSIFTDQSIKPTLLTDVLNPTETLKLKHFSHQKWDRINVKNGDKVWIQLPEETLAQNNQLIGELMAQIQKNVSKSTLFLITGRQNQFQSIDLESEKKADHRIRKARSAGELKQKTNESDTRLVDIKDCLFFYTTDIHVFNVSTESELIDSFNTSIDTISPDPTNSVCWNSSLPKEPGLLKVSFKNANGTELDLSLEIGSQSPFMGDFWSLLENSTAKVMANFAGYEKGITFDLYGSQITAEQTFGYSCNYLSVYSKPANNSNNELVQILLKFRHFQLQPFKNPYNKKAEQRQYVFTDTFDCEVWMTLPLWMGLLTLIVLFVILYIGIYFIAYVNTPDRFENPKGKPLMINTSED